MRTRSLAPAQQAVHVAHVAEDGIDRLHSGGVRGIDHA